MCYIRVNHVYFTIKSLSHQKDKSTGNSGPPCSLRPPCFREFPGLELSKSKDSGFKALINTNDHEADRWKLNTYLLQTFLFNETVLHGIWKSEPTMSAGPLRLSWGVCIHVHWCWVEAGLEKLRLSMNGFPTLGISESCKGRGSGWPSSDWETLT